MLALKNSVIDLHHSEKKTLVGFFSLYITLCIVILLFISFVYYKFQKDLMLSQKRINLQNYSNEFIIELKQLHINFDKTQVYPRDKRFKTAIYDSDKQLIFSTLTSSRVQLDNIVYTSNNTIHFIKEPESYYLGARYVILEIEDDQTWLDDIEQEIMIFTSIGLIIMLFIGYWLLQLFIKPMRDAMHLLDRFIKDTTHELNTPISAIVANIEMINTDDLDEKLARKIRRIDIGAKTVSNIYQDLTYLTLNHKIMSQNEEVDIGELLYQRVEYFDTLANVKHIKFQMEIKDKIFLFMDVKKLSKLIDNLISNAIKYNKIDGFIKITLEQNSLSIQDSGKGIKEEQLALLYDRYSRFDKTVGGFGIGLNIVSMICKEYDLGIEITSQVNKGTKVEVTWK
ncbi:MAG: HAMP domain-containing histidine kinase [Campylobacteraceae bacterium]|nr:HAMP domain-containing histidine kinase [Campylobacteraceae bacterium]